MKIHTTAAPVIDLAPSALLAAKDAGTIPPHVYFDQLSPAGSRTRTYGGNVHLCASHKAIGDRRRYANTGFSGADRDTLAATYDEWGHFLAALFDLDPTAVAGPYKSRDDFHAQTSGKYRIAATV